MEPTTTAAAETYTTPNYNTVELKEFNGKQYKVSRDFWFNAETQDAVIDAIITAKRSGERVRIYCGDAETGKDWGERWDVLGYIGRSTGSVKIPLLIYNRRSSGGGGILTHCIVKIRYSSGSKRVIYQHPTYTAGQYTVGPNDNPDSVAKGYLFAVYQDGKQFFGCKTREAAEKELRFMTE